MKDIDFDELDKAVSSVLSQASGPAPKDELKTTPAVASATPKDVAAAEASEVIEVKKPADGTAASVSDATEVPVKVEATGAEPSKPVAFVMPGRKTGRFMDVVHPSSDMGASKTAAPTLRVSAGRTLQPLTAASGVKPTEATEDRQEPDAAPSEARITDSPDVVVKVPEATEISGEPAWPDPIALADEDPGETASTPEDASMTAVEAAAQPSVPLFIEDAKVEKRPLGAFSDATALASAEPATTDSSTGPLPQADPAISPEPVATFHAQDNKLPPELDVDVVSVESDDAGLEDGPQATQAATPVSAPLNTGLNGSMSIPQQYQQADTPTAQAAHSLFDTTDYHPPLNVQADHGSNHLWVWVIIAVLLLLGTAGLFVYWYAQGMTL